MGFNCVCLQESSSISLETKTMSWWLSKSWRRRRKYQRGVDWKMPRKKQQNPQPVKCTYGQISPVLEGRVRNSAFGYFVFLQLRLAQSFRVCVLIRDSHLETRCCCFSAAIILHPSCWTAGFVKFISHLLKHHKKFRPFSICFFFLCTHLMRLTKCSFI